MELAELTVEAAAFTELYDTRRPLTVDRLAARLGARTADVEPVLSAIEEQGHLLRGADNTVVAVAGLSVEPTRHRLVIDEVTRWTWCAWDALGLVHLVGRGGQVLSTSPLTNVDITVQFDGDEIVATPHESVLLYAQRPDGCVTVRDWCPNVNLFESADAAEAWMDQHDIKGELQEVAQAAQECAEYYRPLLVQPKKMTWWRRLRARLGR